MMSSGFHCISWQDCFIIEAMDAAAGCKFPVMREEEPVMEVYSGCSGIS